MAKRPISYDDVANELAEDLPGGDLSGTALSAIKVKKASEDFALPGDISPSQITANQNDYNPTGLATASVLRLTSDASRDITGLQGGADGRIVVVLNRGSNPIVLKHESASSTAANRFKFPTGGDHTLVAGGSATLIYDSTDSRWLPIQGTGSSAFSVWDPDIAPASPSAYNDEFDGTSGVSWTDVNWSGLTAWDANTTYPGWLWAKNPTGTEVLRCKLQALPAGDFTIITKANIGGGTGTVVAGLVLSTTNTASSGTQFTAAIARRSSAFAYGSQKYANFTTFSSDLVNIGSAHPNGTIWLRLRLSGSTYYAGFSIDGKTWYDQSISPAVTPSYMGIFVDNAASGQNHEVSFDYFRYSSSAGATFGGVRTYNSTTVPGTVAPYDAQYLVLATNGTLTGERVLTFGGQFTTTDGGAGSTFTVKFTAIDRVTKTASYTATSAEYGSVIEVNSASATTQTLPTAVGITGKTISYKNVGAGLITMATTSSQTIDGATAGNTTIGQWDTRTFYSDGSNWLSQGSQSAALQGASPTLQAGERRYDTTLASPANGAGGGLPVYVGGGIFAGTQTTDPTTGSSPYAISPSGVGTRTLPANSQKAGSVYEIEAFVYYGSSQTPQFVLKYGASDSTGVTMTTSGYYFHIKLRYTVLTTGATGSARVIWNITTFDSGGAQVENRSGNETLTINTTSSLTLGLGSTASGTNFVDMLMRKVI